MRSLSGWLKGHRMRGPFRRFERGRRSEGMRVVFKGMWVMFNTHCYEQNMVDHTARIPDPRPKQDFFAVYFYATAGDHTLYGRICSIVTADKITSPYSGD